MANITYIKNIGRPNATYKLLDRRTGKVVASTTADATGAINVSVPPGSWEEQITFTLPEGGGVNKTYVQNSPNEIEFGIASAQHGPLVTSPDGSVWQLTVSNAGVVAATKLA